MKNWKSYIPAILVGALAAIYIIFNYFFVQCPITSICQQADAMVISEIDPNKAVHLCAASNKLEELKNTNANTQLSNSNTNTANTNTKTSNANTSNTNVNIADLSARVDELKQDVDELKTAKDKKTVEISKNAAKDNVTLFLTSISSRYSSRRVWVFLTALLFAICLATIWFSYHAVREAFEGQWKRYFLITSGIAFVVFLAGFADKYFMLFVLPMFEESIYKYGDISSFTVRFSNAFVFAAIVFLVAASSAVFYKVKEINGKTRLEQEKREKLETRLGMIEEVEEKFATDREVLGTESETEKMESELTDKYKKCREYSRILLYIGSAMLFVGLSRIYILSNWHITFVNATSEPFLNKYFEISLYVQGIFYTILLASIYLPISYSMPETSDSSSVKNSLQNEGFWATMTIFAPRLIAIFSPLLAGPVLNLIKAIYFGGESQ